MRITNVVSPKTLTVICRRGEYTKAIIALVEEAQKQGICPAVIAVTRVEDVCAIILWGD